MTFNSKTVEKYVAAGLNVLVSGPAGTGKTAILTEVCEKLGLTMKYYEASKIDPFTELIGIPVPQPGTKTVEYYRPRGINDAEVIFIDEINRADDRVLNTLFELVQHRSINHEPLPKLKCVIAAMNPPTDDYTVNELDLAFQDRFDTYLTAIPHIDFDYFKRTYSEPVASVALQWWNDYHNDYTRALKTDNVGVYLSPRRMEKLVRNFQLVPQLSTLQDTMPPGAVGDLATLRKKLSEAFKIGDNLSASNYTGDMAKVMAFEYKDLKVAANKKLLEEVITSLEDDLETRDHLLTKVALLLGHSDFRISPELIVKNYWFAIRHMKPSQEASLSAKWDIPKRERYHNSKTARRYEEAAEQ